MLTLGNPVFAAYAIAAALMVLKIMGQGWMTVWRMLRAGGGYASPEDLRRTLLNPAPDPRQLAPDDYVERSRRMHRNDLENIPAFLAIGILFVLIEPPLIWAQIFFYGFVAARAAHAIAYATARNHETRATFYTIGSLIVMAMAVWVLVAALGA